MKKGANFKTLIIVTIIVIISLLALSYLTKVKQVKYVDPDDDNKLITHNCIGFIKPCTKDARNCIPECTGIKYNYKCYESVEGNYKVRTKC